MTGIAAMPIESGGPATAPLTDAQVAALREAAEKATPGPWKAGDAAWFRGQTNPEDGKRPISAGANGVMANVYGRANAEFIAAASPDVVIALLDELDSLRTMVKP